MMKLRTNAQKKFVCLIIVVDGKLQIVFPAAKLLPSFVSGCLFFLCRCWSPLPHQHTPLPGIEARALRADVPTTCMTKDATGIKL
jgi:hypothetical protein